MVSPVALPDDVVEKYIRAGRIAAIVREEAARRAEPGVSLLELAEYVEDRIRELGGEPAFPVNISINHVAAHYTPLLDDELVIPEESVVKIDIGAHIDGYIADTAVTVAFNEKYIELLEAAREALEKALRAVEPGRKAWEIGYVVEETIKSHGYKPIYNLTGHSIGRYMIHAGKSIPNYPDRSAGWVFGDGAYAIEPFATTGSGYVRDTSLVTIYALRTNRPRARLSIREKRVIREIWMKRRSLPFPERWLKPYAETVEGVRALIRSLFRHGALIIYPVLVETRGSMVAQFEHTLVINGDEVIVTTKYGEQ